MADPASFKRVIKYGDYTFDYTRVNVNSVNNFSGADGDKTLLHTTTRFRISGFIISDDFKSFAEDIIDFRAALATPRQNFSIINDDETWYITNFDEKNNAKSDVLYGPNCVDFDITEFTGGLAASYSVTIEVTEKICGSSGISASKHVLQITRDTNFSIDADGLVNRNVSGVLIVTQQGFPPDRSKELVQVKVPTNFKRISQTYQVLADGVTMRYSIIDQEQFNTLPKGVTTGDVDFVISTDFGAKITLTLSGNFSVANNFSKKLAFKEMVNLLDKYFVPFKQKGFAFTKQEVKTSIYSNNLEFLFTGFMAGDIPVRDIGKNSIFNLLIATPPGSTGKAKHIPQGGSAGLLADTRPIDDACDGVKKTKRKGVLKRPDPIVLIPSPGDRSTTLNALSSTREDISSEHKEFLYVDYHEKISYEIESNRLVFVPKKKDVAQIVQQVTVPTVYVVQSGYATRRGAPPDVPGPVVTQPAGYILQESLSPDQPILADGIKIYTTNWRYVIRVVDNNFKVEEIKAPDDPRKRVTTEEKDLNIPSEMQLDNL